MRQLMELTTEERERVIINAANLWSMFGDQQPADEERDAEDVLIRHVAERFVTTMCELARKAACS